VDAVFGVFGDELGLVEIGMQLYLMTVGDDEARSRLHKGFKLCRREITNSNVLHGTCGEEEGHGPPSLLGGGQVSGWGRGIGMERPVSEGGRTSIKSS